MTAGREVIRRLETTDDVRGLVAWLVSVERDRPIVCVTTRHYETDPLVDIDALAGSVAEAADIYLLSTGDLTWEQAGAGGSCRTSGGNPGADRRPADVREIG